MQRRFRVLRVVATIFKILAWFFLALGVIGAGVLLASGTGAAMPFELERITILSEVGAAIVTLLTGIALFLFLFTIGGVTSVLLAIEENTRATADQVGLSQGPPLRY